MNIFKDKIDLLTIEKLNIHMSEMIKIYNDMYFIKTKRRDFNKILSIKFDEYMFLTHKNIVLALVANNQFAIDKYRLDNNLYDKNMNRVNINYDATKKYIDMNVVNNLNYSNEINSFEYIGYEKISRFINIYNNYKHGHVWKCNNHIKYISLRKRLFIQNNFYGYNFLVTMLNQIYIEFNYTDKYLRSE